MLEQGWDISMGQTLTSPKKNATALRRMWVRAAVVMAIWGCLRSEYVPTSQNLRVAVSEGGAVIIIVP